MNKIVLLLVIVVFFYILQQQNKFIEPLLVNGKPSPTSSLVNDVLRPLLQPQPQPQPPRPHLIPSHSIPSIFVSEALSTPPPGILIYTERDFIGTMYNFPKGSYDNGYFSDIRSINNNSEFIILYELAKPYLYVGIITPHSKDSNINIKGDELIEFHILTKDELNTLVDKRIKGIEYRIKQDEQRYGPTEFHYKILNQYKKIKETMKL
jgi:hypothetical protein